MKILICEDEEAIRHILEVTLTPRGHVIEGAGNVPAAIKLFEEAREAGEPFDLIIADIGLPGPSGYSLAGYVRERDKDVRIAALTGSPMETGNLAQVEAEYWRKPEALGDIVNLVEANNE